MGPRPVAVLVLLIPPVLGVFPKLPVAADVYKSRGCPCRARRAPPVGPAQFTFSPSFFISVCLILLIALIKMSHSRHKTKWFNT